MEIPSRLNPREMEPRLYSAWKRSGLFHVPVQQVLEEGREPFVIVIPPPNVTAVLHMGHGLNNTIQDVLVRWRRMEGKASLWVPGTDHAGIATQNVVERLLADEGKTRHDLGREAFVERTWAFVRETGSTILEQLEAIGCSCDWERTRFTLDPGLSRAVREVFVRLYQKGLIYKGEYIINWCPRCQTALANEEAEAEEVRGRLYHLRYPLDPFLAPAAARARAGGAAALGKLSDGRWYLTVSTTRPETMLGDMAVAVHPDDQRYRELVGGEVELPLTGRRIPVVADPYVDRDFGTGMVKVTPAHDPNDFELARRHGIAPLEVMTPEGRMGDNVPEPFRGLDRFEAREAVLVALEKMGLLGGATPHSHTLPRCYRCQTVVEPRLSDQWFVRMKPLAEPALEASRQGVVTFVPGRWQKVYEQWLENIRDWCISRQLWWGHRIPVWYCHECGQTLVVREDPTQCPHCGDSRLQQDPDVLDTWFSSWLWPFSVFGWPEDTPDLKVFYPGHVLSTAPEILFFWVARMIMAGYEFMGRAPFRTVYLHGTVRDTEGRKMSKSLGNGIDPLEVVEKFGADALRFTVISAAAVGTDIYLDPHDLEASFAPGRNFANKVWNAGRFALMNLGSGPVMTLAEVADELRVPDRWILSRLNRTVLGITRDLEKFRLHDAAEGAYHFFWGEFADWYLELLKPRLKNGGRESGREAARAVLVTALDIVLRLLHPLIPFVTEELWQKLPWCGRGPRPPFLMVAPWPEPRPEWEDTEAEARMAEIQDLVIQTRRLRKEYGVSEAAWVKLVLAGVPDPFRTTLVAEEYALRTLARVEHLNLTGEVGKGPGAHCILANGTELFLPLEGLLDVEREIARLEVELHRVERQLAGGREKLADEVFLARAPRDVVEREREKAASLEELAGKLAGKLRALRGH